MEYLDLHKEINNTRNRLGGVGNGGLVFHGHGVSVCLETGGGNDHRITSM